MTDHVGIDDIALATTGLVVDLGVLAQAHSVDPDKFYVGIGQSEMSIAGEDEDVVSLAAAAVQTIADRTDISGVRTLLLATETGVDQSKAAGVFVHGVLGLPPNVRVVELKQACYAGTAALMMARSLVCSDPSEKVLVVAVDVAKYDVGSGGEPTQGAGAVAMLITADPSILRIEPKTGVHTDDVMDFWRPNHRTTALVDGKFSIEAYMRSLEGAWTDYRAHDGFAYDDFDHFCYHQPFTKMANKAHAHLVALNGGDADKAEIAELMGPTQTYNRRIGNTYTASIYVGLLSLLETVPADLAGHRVGMFSYGSGSVGEFWSGTVVPGYQLHLDPELTATVLDGRKAIDHEAYLHLHDFALPIDGTSMKIDERAARNGFRLAGVDADRRQYERFEPTSAVLG